MGIQPLGQGFGARLKEHNQAIIDVFESVCPDLRVDSEGVWTSGDHAGQYGVSLKWSPRWGIGLSLTVFEDGYIRYKSFGIFKPKHPEEGESSLTQLDEVLRWVKTTARLCKKK